MQMLEETHSGSKAANFDAYLISSQRILKLLSKSVRKAHVGVKYLSNCGIPNKSLPPCFGSLQDLQISTHVLPTMEPQASPKDLLH